MGEAVGFADRLLWGLVCPKCGLDRDLSELGYESVRIGDKIRYFCECGCEILKVVGKDMGKEAER